MNTISLALQYTNLSKTLYAMMTSRRLRVIIRGRYFCVYVKSRYICARPVVWWATKFAFASLYFRQQALLLRAAAMKSGSQPRSGRVPRSRCQRTISGPWPLLSSTGRWVAASDVASYPHVMGPTEFYLSTAMVIHSWVFLAKLTYHFNLRTNIIIGLGH